MSDITFQESGTSIHLRILYLILKNMKLWTVGEDLLVYDLQLVCCLQTFPVGPAAVSGQGGDGPEQDHAVNASHRQDCHAGRPSHITPHMTNTAAVRPVYNGQCLDWGYSGVDVCTWLILLLCLKLRTSQCYWDKLLE